MSIQGEKLINLAGSKILYDDLRERIDEKYTKPVTGINKNDLESTVKASLDKADSAYQKPVSGIPASDLADGVIQNVIDDTAGIGDTDVAWSANKTKTEMDSIVVVESTQPQQAGNKLWIKENDEETYTVPTYTELTTGLNTKVNKPVSEGTSGQILRTNGNGTTTWVSVGLPTDAQTESAVNDWLKDHPEATTTVQDGAITYQKLDSSLQGSLSDITDIKNELNSKVDIDGISQVTPENLQIMDVEFSPNLIDETKLTSGIYVTKDGTEHSSNNYITTDYIPVESGEDYCFSWMYQSWTGATLAFFSCYDANKDAISSAGSDTSITQYPITIASNVAYVRLSFSSSAAYKKYQFEKGTTPTEYHPYGVISAIIKDRYLPVTSETIEVLESEIDSKVDVTGTDQITADNLQIVDKTYSVNLYDPETTTDGIYINPANGAVLENSGYLTTDYIPVEAGEKYYGTWQAGASRVDMYLNFVTCYDSNKDFVPSTGMSSPSNPITIPIGVSFIRISNSNMSYYSKRQFEKGETPTEYNPYGILSAMINNNYLPIDETLTTEGMIADAKETGDRISALHDMIDRFIPVDGVDLVTPKNLQIVSKTYSPNLYNTETVTNGIYLNPANGSISENGGYLTTDYIPVEAGQKYYGSWSFGGSVNDHEMGLNFVTCFDASKAVVGAAGMTGPSNPITIPNGVSFIRISHTNQTYYTKRQFEKGETSTPYHPYGEILSAVIDDQYLPDDPVEMADIPAFQLVDGPNLVNRDDPDYITGQFLTVGGGLSDNSNYITSGYIAVKPGEYLVSSYETSSGTAIANMRTIACYNASKTALNTKGAYSVFSFTVPEGVSFIRVCWGSGSYGIHFRVEKVAPYQSFTPGYKEYEPPHYELKPEYMYPVPAVPENVYLPSDIYVAVGRTIELYNEQVVLDHTKYHFRWQCANGYAYKRKFSITGSTAGDYSLRLTLYDDKQRVCWSGTSTVHVVAASNPTKKIMPIGDSLTNWKRWLPEVIYLSSNNITFVGTRYSGLDYDSAGNSYPSGTIHHEGRSGWGAEQYLSDSIYTFDNHYDGVPGVAGSANPFWDGSKFSLSHYLTTQTGVDTPDAVQIFLGTNDLTDGVETAKTNIVAMVDSIRAEYADMPIFVCNTIYRSNQDGYGSTGNDAYAGSGSASAWQYEQDAKVMGLMAALRSALEGYTGVYMIPLATCMDREYGFGQVMTKVNPRSTVEVAMPEESVHPSVVGYYQFADLMYSTYCGVLGT